MKTASKNIVQVASSFAIFAIVLSFMMGQAFAADPNTRPTNPTAVSIEAAGRALMWSVNLDRALSDNFSAGMGIGTVGMNDLAGNDANQTAVMIPVYGNYYFIKEAGSPYVTAGVSLVTNSGSVQDLKSKAGNLQFSSSPITFNFGAGYEYRSDAGYLFRLAVYGLYAGHNLAPWAGITIGYSF